MYGFPRRQVGEKIGDLVLSGINGSISTNFFCCLLTLCLTATNQDNVCFHLGKTNCNFFSYPRCASSYKTGFTLYHVSYPKLTGFSATPIMIFANPVFTLYTLK